MFDGTLPKSFDEPETHSATPPGPWVEEPWLLLLAFAAAMILAAVWFPDVLASPVEWF